MVTLLPTIGGLEAEGLVDDIGERLRAIEGVSDVRVTKNRDPQERYTATCRFRGTPTQASRRLAQAVRDLAHPGSEAHRTERGPGEVIAEFVTWRDGAWSATGRIVATLIDGGEQPGLRNRAPEGPIGS